MGCKYAGIKSTHDVIFGVISLARLGIQRPPSPAVTPTEGCQNMLACDLAVAERRLAKGALIEHHDARHAYLLVTSKAQLMSTKRAGACKLSLAHPAAGEDFSTPVNRHILWPRRPPWQHLRVETCTTPPKLGQVQHHEGLPQLARHEPLARITSGALNHTTALLRK